MPRTPAGLTGVDIAFIIAHSALAVGFGTGALLRYKEAKNRNGGEPQRPFGALGAESNLAMPKPLRTGGGTRGPVVARSHTVRSIDHRVSFILERARHGGKHPEIRERVAKVLTRVTKRNGKAAWATRENDWRAENEAAFAAIRNPTGELALRYLRDPLYAELFQHPRIALETKSGDCDDQVILLASTLLAIGHPVKLRVVWFQRDKTWGHIYLVARDDIENAESWQPLDLTPVGRRGRHMPPGWEVPGATEAIKTGKPSGYVLRVKEYVV